MAVLPTLEAIAWPGSLFKCRLSSGWEFWLSWDLRFRFCFLIWSHGTLSWEQLVVGNRAVLNLPRAYFL